MYPVVFLDFKRRVHSIQVFSTSLIVAEKTVKGFRENIFELNSGES